VFDVVACHILSIKLLVKETSYPLLISSLNMRMQSSFLPLWRMKDLNKITEIQPQIKFVEETMYGKDDLQPDKFSLKVYDLSTKFSKAMWKFRAKTISQTIPNSQS
jgi:hypothetical protein